ncbi:hypothetical protein [Vibrio phage 2 TSL-2019]|uniref:Uncharacterized protein n=1 Tax=Vibrio phage 2 TSL-2019 TaxID=2508172 RepID=A0A513PW71_9CAUD|nr:hypothetical protein HWC03_gp003 [Vibrio phage 2 TSL-2019]QAU04158.1 hypothetical protein [Vibrio phage 2 TSL-2019]
MNVNTINHSFNIPPATDIEALMTFVGGLLNAHQVPNGIQTLQTVELDHPIEESKRQLMQEAYRLNELISGLKSQYSSVEVTDAKMAGLTVMIVFKVSGDRSNEFISIS